VSSQYLGSRQIPFTIHFEIELAFCKLLFTVRGSRTQKVLFNSFYFYFSLNNINVGYRTCD
jgi:hypothetical protein